MITAALLIVDNIVKDSSSVDYTCFKIEVGTGAIELAVDSSSKDSNRQDRMVADDDLVEGYSIIFTVVIPGFGLFTWINVTIS